MRSAVTRRSASGCRPWTHTKSGRLEREAGVCAGGVRFERWGEVSPHATPEKQSDLQTGKE